MSQAEEQITSKPHSRRGQTMAEFALTLPILLLLMFGVIEFARIFQAWVTLQNSARAGARYAITGRWDEDLLADAIGYSIPGGLTIEEQRRAAALDELVPCTDGADTAFTNHWGHDCQPGAEEDQWLRQDMARLPSIVHEARIGAAGLGLEDGDHMVGLHTAGGTEINSETVGEDERGWFHVWICSSRPPINSDVPARYEPSEDRRERLCEVKEPGQDGMNQYDAGGPGDAVEIIVFFNHPLITPLGLLDYIQLTARRVMINEAFRSTRVVQLPPQLALPTYTPSRTPMPSDTPPPSITPTITTTPSRTPTSTGTATESATPSPTCDRVLLNQVRLVDTYLELRIYNANEYGPIFITRAEVQWELHALYPSMYLNDMRITGRTSFWSGPDYSPPTIADTTDPRWLDDDYLRRFDANTITPMRVRFTNGPAVLANYFTLDDFIGTKVYLSTTWAGTDWDPANDCMVEITGDMVPTPASTPTPFTHTPTRTPTPTCTNYVVRFVGFEYNAVVRFSIRNADLAPAYITGFRFNWNSTGRPALPALALDLVSVGGTSAFDPAAVVMWDGNVTTPPAVAASGSAEWLVNPVIQPGQTVDVWFDLDGTAGRVSDLGYADYDFNDTSFTLNFICNGEPPDRATPAPTNTPAPTLTPSQTRTPSMTPTPSKTYTPSKTPTQGPVTPTNTPSNTPIPTNTRTPLPMSPTYTPTDLCFEC